VKIVTVMAGKASNLHDYFPCNPGGGSVSGSDCLASVVRALGSHCRRCNRQLEHDRAVVEPLDSPSRIESATKPLRRDRKSGTRREFSKRRRSSGEKLSPQAKSWSTPSRIVQQPLSLWLRTMITMFVRLRIAHGEVASHLLLVLGPFTPECPLREVCGG
jgi:hypothetical protein